MFQNCVYLNKMCKSSIWWSVCCLSVLVCENMTSGPFKCEPQVTTLMLFFLLVFTLFIHNTVSYCLNSVSNQNVCGFALATCQDGGYRGPQQLLVNVQKSGEWPTDAMSFKGTARDCWTPRSGIDWMFHPWSSPCNRDAGGEDQKAKEVKEDSIQLSSLSSAILLVVYLFVLSLHLNWRRHLCNAISVQY